MADDLKIKFAGDNLFVSHVGLNVEYQLTPQQNVHQIVGQVLFLSDPNSHSYTGDIPVGITPSSAHSLEIAKAVAVTATITVSGVTIHQGAGEFVTVGSVSIGITPSVTTIHNQVYDGSILIEIAPTAVVTRPDRAYNGSIEIDIVVTAISRQPVVGWDSATGYGLVDISCIADDPPFFGFDGEIEIGLDPSASTFQLYAQKDIVASGGAEMGGEGTVESDSPPVTSPSEYRIVADDSCFAIEGGSLAYGTPEYYFTTPGVPETRLIVGSGGWQIAPADFHTAYRFVPPAPSIPKIISIAPFGGFIVEGETSYEFVDFDLVTVVGKGGIGISSDFFPTVTWGIVDGPPTTPIEPEQWGFIEIGGGDAYEFVEFEVIVPDLPLRLYDAPDLALDGSGQPLWVVIPQIVKRGSGGVVLGGVTTAFDGLEAHTWVASGMNLETSFYIGYNFNSYAVRNGKVYAAGEDGIYLIGGDTDDGESIVSGLRIGPTNFMLKNRKYIRNVLVGDSAEGVQVRIFTEADEVISDVIGGKALGSRDVFDESVGIDVSGFDDLQTMDIAAVVAAYRG